MVGFADLDNGSDFLMVDLVVFKVELDAFAWMGMVFSVFRLEVEQSWNVGALRIDGLCVDSGGVVREPHPVVVALSDAQLELFFLDLYLNLHL